MSDLLSPVAGFSAHSGLMGVAVGIAGSALLLAAMVGHGAFTNRRFAQAGLQVGWPEHLLVGAGTWSLLVFLSGWLGNYHPIAGLLLTGFVAGTSAIMLGHRAFTARRLPTETRECQPWLSLWPVLPVALVFLLALATPVVFWDSRAYHLAIPEFLALRGSLIRDPSFVFAWYPQAMECLYALSLPFGEVAAKIVNAAFLVAAAAIAARSARSPLAATIVLTMPGMLFLAYVPKNAGLLALAGIVSFERALNLGSDKPGRPATFLAGLAAGIACATHYAALWHLVFLVPLVLRRGGWRSFPTFFAGIALFAAPTYLRNFLMTGNPVYPFLGSLFGTWPPASIHAGHLPGFAQLVDRLAALPWTGVEALGIGSTLGLVLPAGVLVAWLYRKEYPVPDVVPRVIVGLGLLAVSISLYGFVRFGIAGVFFLAPVAAAGLDRWPRAARVACAAYALAGALLLLTGPFDPLLALREQARLGGADVYRSRYDAAWPLTATARQLPPGARIASVAILRSQGWGARLEPAGEDFPPAIAAALRETHPAAALRRAGFTHLAVDVRELHRLRHQYRYLDWDEVAEQRWQALLGTCRLVAGDPGRAFLAELPAE